MSTQLNAGYDLPDLEDVGPPREWFALGLRFVMGWIFLTAGLGKVLGDFTAAGYLANVEPVSPASGLYAAMAASPTMLAFIDVAIPWGQVLIGLGLLVGGLVRLAAFFGALQSLAFYFGNWEFATIGEFAMGFVTSELVYMAVFLTIAALAAGRYYGLDARLETIEIDGEPLVARYPKLRYVLG